MHPTELSAAKLKIENSIGEALNETLRQIVTLGDFPLQLLPSVIAALQQNKIIPNQTLCDILISTRSKDLYQTAKNNRTVGFGNWELVRLLETDFPAPEIEQLLKGELFKIFKDDSNLLRREIVKVMAKNGGSESLELLKTIEYELASSLPEHRYDANQTLTEECNLEALLKKANPQRLEDYLTEVRSAIDKITNRPARSTNERHIDSTSDNLKCVLTAVDRGECTTVEFKETFAHDTKKGTMEKYIRKEALDTIAAFLNSNGGVFLIGVRDADRKITGLNGEIEKFHKDSDDKFLLNFGDYVKHVIGEEFYPFFDYQLVNVDAHKVLLVECRRSTVPCFCERKEFYVRKGPKTEKLEGQKVHDYINIHFNGTVQP